MTRRLVLAALVWLVASAAVFAVQLRGDPPFAGTYVYYLGENDFGPVSPDARRGSAIAADTDRFKTSVMPDGVQLALPAGTIEATRAGLTERFWAERWQRRRAALALPAAITVAPAVLLLLLALVGRAFHIERTRDAA